MNHKQKSTIFPTIVLRFLLLSLCVSLTSIFVVDNVFGQSTGRAPKSESTDNRMLNPVFTGNRMLQEYIDLVKQGNIESASMHWSPYARARSERLGIHYDGISIKADLNSPLIKLDRLHPIITLKSGGQLDSSFLRLRIEAKQNNEVTSYNYYTQRMDDYQWLTFPQDYVAQDWPTRESRYFRFYISPGRDRYVNQLAIESLDNFVDSLGLLLAISPQSMQTLADKKIDYYFCSDEQEVERITGVAVRGLYDLAADALITSALPHYHEVAHLMVNYRLQSMPLTTLPLLREGMATYLGGRSTRSPSSLLDMAAYLYRLDVVEVDSLLELMAFHTDLDASISYSAAGLFIKSLVDSYGMEAVLEAYRELSGNLDQTRQLSSAAIREVFEKRFGVKWEEISERFQKEYISGDFHATGPDVYLRPGLAGMAAGDSTRLLQMGLASEPLEESAESLSSEMLHSKTMLFKTIRNVTLIESNGRIYVRARPDRAGQLKVTILYGKLEQGVLSASELFEEQFTGTPSFQGYRFGLRFDEHEVGIYDYATSTLLAKYLASFDPEAPYSTPADSTVSFSFPLTLTADVSPLNDPVLLSY